MQPHLVRWDRELRAQGLTIVYVADGRRVGPEALLQGMQRDGASFPLLHDGAGTLQQTYQIRAYPTGYVLGRDGRVLWEGIPHFNPAAPERAIRAALATRSAG